MLLFMMADALRHDYITPEDSPYLHSLSASGMSGSVMPSFGFEPDAAYLAGLSPSEADGGTMFWLDPEHSPFRFTRFLPPTLDKLPQPIARTMRKAIRLFAQLSAKESRLKQWAAPVWIPLPLLSRFAFAANQRMDEPGFVPPPACTIFDRLRLAGVQWYFHGMPGYRVNSTSVHSRFLAEYQGQEYVFLHIGDLDGVGHRRGPLSPERKSALRQFDRLLHQIVNHARSKNSQVNLIVLGDHGMTQVDRVLDITPLVNRLTAQGLVFDYFIDATLFRCWSKDPGTLLKIRDEINRLPGLVEIGVTEIQRYGLQYHHNRFWDLCWQLEPGLMFTPNFHNGNERLLGMHGYLPECQDSRSAFVISGPRLPNHLIGQRLENVDMKRFFGTQLVLLDIPARQPIAESLF